MYESWTQAPVAIQYNSVTQALSYSFACHVSCKVKYFGSGKVANI